jgi:hypothetical protein
MQRPRQVLRWGGGVVTFILACIGLIDLPKQVGEWVVRLTGLNAEAARSTLFGIGMIGLLAFSLGPAVWRRLG